ncbi:MAG: TonB-dependent receptor plug domain-containing protein, partial [Bacteroidia bacterium]
MIKYIFASCLLCLLQFSVSAQHQVKGVITDENGQAITGATVLVVDENTGMITDSTGSYQVSVADAQNARIAARFNAYKTQVIVVAGRNEINFVLVPDVKQLDEVVISAIGLEQRSDNIGATISKINTGDVVRSGETLLLNGLAGKSSNLKIARSNGEPGAGSTIQIRGANTITGSSSPLIILDGVPIDNSTTYGGGDYNSNRRIAQSSRLNDLNPNDIASIQVLKGASAASLWGSRAANGVLVITTKQGKAGQLKISLNSSVSFDQVL